MLKPASLILILLFALFLAGCGAGPLFHLRSIEEPYRWYQGQQVVKRSVGGLDVYLTFDEQSGENLIFYVELFNASDESIIVSPELFVCHTYKNLPGEPRSAHRPGKVLRPLNPEDRITHITKTIASERSRHTTLVLLDATLEVLTAVGDAATTRTKEQAEERNEERGERDRKRAEREVHHATRMAELESQRELWRSEAFRKTTLFPDESVGGKIFIPLDPDARYVEIVISIKNDRQEVLYEQVKL